MGLENCPHQLSLPSTSKLAMILLTRGARSSHLRPDVYCNNKCVWTEHVKIESPDIFSKVHEVHEIYPR